MKLKPHNPDYKLIEVCINYKQFVYGETNGGENPGLEVYYYKMPYIKGDTFYYSRRFAPRFVPQSYNELMLKLKKLIPYCPPGQKLTFQGGEYVEYCNILQSQQKQAA